MNDMMRLEVHVFQEWQCQSRKLTGRKSFLQLEIELQLHREEMDPAGKVGEVDSWNSASHWSDSDSESVTFELLTYIMAVARTCILVDKENHRIELEPLHHHGRRKNSNSKKKKD